MKKEASSAVVSCSPSMFAVAGAGDQVFGRRLGADGGQAGEQVGEGLPGAENLEHRLIEILAEELRVGSGQDDVGVGQDHLVLIIRDAHHLADDGERRPRGDLLHEVARPGLQQVIDDRRGHLLDVVVELLIIRGVNARDTMRRSRACRGSSMLIIDPKYSLNSTGRSAIVVAPLPEQNTSGWRLASTTSACRTSA